MLSSSSSRSEDYLVIASGQTRYAPCLVGWQEFKDHVRKYVKEQPGWTSVKPGRQRGESQGWCRLRDQDDAQAVYNIFQQCHGILVHVFQTSLLNGHFELVQCNCAFLFPEVGASGHSSLRSGIDVSGVNHTFGASPSSLVQQYPMPTYAAYQYPSYGTPQYAQQTPYAYHMPQMGVAASQTPAYSQTARGLPVNMSQGAMITESRGIFLQGVSYSAHDSDLLAFLQSVGLWPVEAKIRKDANGSSRGVASVKFTTKEEAQLGVHTLNGRTYLGKTLTARLDTEGTVVGQTGPVIVDGTIRSAAKPS